MLVIKWNTYVSVNNAGYRTIDSLYPKSTVPLSGGICVGSSVMDEVKTLNALNACDFYEKADRFASKIPAPNKQPHEKMSVQEQVIKAACHISSCLPLSHYFIMWQTSHSLLSLFTAYMP